MNYEEHDIQAAAVKHVRRLWPFCELALFAVPNGGARNSRTGAILKAEGVTAGVWDLFLAVPIQFYESRKRFICPGLWIEVKRPDMRNRSRGGLTKEQYAFGNEMTRQGYATAVCYTTQEILDTIDEYLKG